jgi:hypothetical protein
LLDNLSNPKNFHNVNVELQSLEDVFLSDLDLVPPDEDEPLLPPDEDEPLLPPDEDEPLLPPDEDEPLLPPDEDEPLLPPYAPLKSLES